MVRHTGIKDWQCNMCPRSFYFQRDLKAHLMQHEGIKKFQCTLCTSTFSTSSALKKHGKIHSDERNFECDKCSLRFRNKGVLEVHYRTHTGEVIKIKFTITKTLNEIKIIFHFRNHSLVCTAKCDLHRKICSKNI